LTHTLLARPDGSPDTELVPREVLPLDRHPALVYLARLAPGSRPTMRQALAVVAEIAAHTTLEDLPWHQLRYPHTLAIRARLAERFAPTTASKILCGLRGVLHEAFRLGLIAAEDYQRARDVAAIRGTRLPRGRALTAGELRALFGLCDRQTNPGARDAALLAVLYGVGLRRAEAVTLDLAHLDLTTNTLRVLGKGNKERAVPLPVGTTQAIQQWLRVRGQDPGRLFLPLTKSGRVMPVDRHGTPRTLTGQAVLVILRRLARRAGVEHFAPHDVRRTFISDLLDAGADLAVVQQLAGHAQVTTTARYDRRGDHARRRAVALLHVPS